MYHEFVCDNCGNTIETHCFDTRDNHRTYYTPPVPVNEIKTMDELGAHLAKASRSAMTTLCITCIKQ